MSNGVKSNTLKTLNIIDEIIGNENGSTGRITASALANQLASSGPLSELFSELNYQIYADEPSGRAAVEDGKIFLAVGANTDSAVDVWERNNATNSTLRRSYADVSLVSSTIAGVAKTESRLGNPSAAVEVVENTVRTQHQAFKGSGALVVGAQYSLEGVFLLGDRLPSLFSPSGTNFNVAVDPITLTTTVLAGSVDGTSATREGKWIRLRVEWTETSASSKNLAVRMRLPDGNVTYTGDGLSSLWIESLTLRNETAGIEIWSATTASSFNASAASLSDGLTPEDLTASKVISNDFALTDLDKALVGANTMTRFTEGVGSVTPNTSQSVSIVAGALTRFEADVKITSGDRRFGLRTVVAGSTIAAIFDPVSGLVDEVTDGCIADAQHLGNEVYRFSVERVAASGGSVRANMQLLPWVGGPTYTADGNGSIDVQEFRYIRDGVLMSAVNDFSGWLDSDLTQTPNAGTFLGLQEPIREIASLNRGARSSSRIAWWGDSLTEGAGSTSGQTVTVQLRNSMKRQVENYGAGSQQAEQIAARAGAIAALLSVASNEIPSSGSVDVVDQSVDVCFFAGTSFSITGHLAGVYGTLTKVTASGGASATTSYSFTRAATGSVERCLPNTPFIPDDVKRDRTHVLWIGRNDYGGVTDPAALATVNETIKRCISSMINKMDPVEKRFIILGVLPSDVATEYVGTDSFEAKLALAFDLARSYPESFIDIAPILLTEGNGSTADNADVANGITPSSLRADAVHLNNAGYALVAAEVKKRMEQNGW